MRRLSLRAGQPGRNESGQAILEMALCLPVMFLIVTGIVTFGIFLSQYLVLTNGVTIAAQQLSESRGQITDPCAVTATAFQGAAPTLKGTLGYTIVLNGTRYSSSNANYWSSTAGFTCSSSSTSTGPAANLVQGTTAQVIVTYPCNLSIYGKDLAPNCYLSAQTAESVQ